MTNTIEHLNALLNCKVLNYDKAKEFKPLALTYCLENRTNKISLKWLRGFFNPQNETRLLNRFSHRLKTILKSNNLSITKELICYDYKRRHNERRGYQIERRFKNLKYIVVLPKN